jgi:membrane-bound serine protease (ClpP class)
MNRNRLLAAWRALCAIAIICAGFVLPLGGLAHPVHAQGTAPRIHLLTFSGAVTPVLDRYLAGSIERAAGQSNATIILQLDTPGGSVDVTQAIIQRMLASPVPVVVWVAPSGARAGSAGTFITLAGHAAAMAPGTSIGAASPVDAGGAEMDATLAAKLTNILSADIENLATRRGDAAVEWAIAAVRDASAATAAQALALGVIDTVAADLPSLIQALDGVEVTVQGRTQTLQLANAVVEDEPLNWLQRFLNFIANPTIAALLITLGTAGLLAEVWNPGTWVPGVIGAVALLLGLYALGQLDANFAGLALMLLGIGLFVAEAATPAVGALLAAGAVSFGLGVALLFDQPGIDVSWPVIIALAAGTGLFVTFASAKGLAAQRRPARTGGEGIIGMSGRTAEAMTPGSRGSVMVNGEWWTAELKGRPVAAGASVRVTGRKGFVLMVEEGSGE